MNAPLDVPMLSLFMLSGLAALATIASLQIKYDFLQKSKLLTCLIWTGTVMVIAPASASTYCSVQLVSIFFIRDLLEQRK